MPDDTAATLSEILGCEPWLVVERVVATLANLEQAERLIRDLPAHDVDRCDQLRLEQAARIETLARELAIARDPDRVKQARINHARSLAPTSGRFRSSILAALHRGKDWAILEEDYYRLVAQPCYVCGGTTGGGIGLDRQDNRRGYHLDNVKPCCGPCNMARGSRLIQPE